MVEAVTFQTIFQFLQTVSIMVGIAYYLMILQNQQKTQKHQQETKKTQLFMQLYQSSSNVENSETYWDIIGYEWDDYEDFVNKYGPRANPESAHRVIAYYYVLDGLGMLVRNDVIDIETVYRMLGRRIINIWFKVETIMEELRKELDPGPDYLEDFEYLALEMVRIRQMKGVPLPVEYLKPFKKVNGVL